MQPTMRLVEAGNVQSLSLLQLSGDLLVAPPGQITAARQAVRILCRCCPITAMRRTFMSLLARQHRPFSSKGACVCFMCLLESKAQERCIAVSSSVQGAQCIAIASPKPDSQNALRVKPPSSQCLPSTMPCRLFKCLLCFMLGQSNGTCVVHPHGVC